MTETKIIHLNQNYSLRVEFDLETKDIHFTALFRSDQKTIENYGLDLIEVIDAYGNSDDHVELLDMVIEIATSVRRWVNELDIDALIAEHARCEAEERTADTREDMERNG